MKCARCSAEVPTHSQFCLRCGTPTNASNAYRAPAPANFTPVAPAPNNRPLIITVGILGVAVLIMAAFMVQSALTQKAGTSNSPNLVQAPAISSPGRLVEAPGDSKPSTPVLAPPAPAEPDYSAINDYLKFVRQVESTKQTLIRKELGAALAQYGNLFAQQVTAATSDDGGKEFLPTINKNPQNFADEWNKLARIFANRVPPQGCVKLRDLYYTHLNSIQGMFNKVHDATSQAGNNQSGDAINALTGMLGTASAEADTTATSADEELADICRACKLEKTFKIATDSGSSSSLLH